MTPRVWVRLMGTGGAANEGRHQACLLVGSGCARPGAVAGGGALED
jgi:hypothetical protein